uniref:Transmembrane protein n=1 Tax=Entomoneis paludosa TaxID=265537 RepID=A0A6U2XD59_9STRA|mmetsp:Transcript_1228/g.2697  ORF Transcript_1228/g.2697 Transcript_1228/m.2697 type:complete len:286 (+) Transcript_1228:240-1097(+)|eukprot:CAMPEP_0172470960 /NCGR_PEP_ID=MMETSP1065-20121228/67569_1 /TAXON_ID=265537 /ORGANISM="Amphiprora paludosa, Strain CCMP125" /LENGTH=285 /DNA_ID=CAMNT_0013229041 /DNA_START=202 /DNA_END=1059 /DNA_ORIENTATION=-
MLAADKLQLQSALKQQATALKEKEFNLHHSNFMTVGTQAAVLAGLDITMFIEFNPPDDAAWASDLQWLSRTLRCVYYAIIVGAFCANMIVVSQTTALSVLGAGLALRGPDGSMMTATEGLYEERSSVFKAFGVGLALTVGSVLLSVWLLLRWEAAIVCFLVALWTTRRLYTMYRRVAQRFDYDESDTVNFDDIFNGPAAIRAVPMVASSVVRAAVPVTASRFMGWGRSNSAPVVDKQQDEEEKQDTRLLNGDSTTEEDDLETGGARTSSNRRSAVKNRKPASQQQ